MDPQLQNALAMLRRAQENYEGSEKVREEAIALSLSLGAKPSQVMAAMADVNPEARPMIQGFLDATASLAYPSTAEEAMSRR